MKRRAPALILLVIVVIAYSRLFAAGFVAFDDDFQVYANPFLNPPTFQGLARLWLHAYQQLYVPLAYTILAGLAQVAGVPAHVDGTLGQTVSLAPGPFHAASIALHALNVWLCFCLIRRLIGRPRVAWLCALVFAVHPLQVESVAWVSELRGLTSSLFALLALNAFVLSRQVGERGRSVRLAILSALLVACAMLCKPSAAILPAVALAIDRIVLGTPWRKALAGAAVWAAVVVPFVLVTRATQSVPAAARSSLWQRPFIAGDALAFTLFKCLVPFNLGVDYGRSPRWVMSHAWGYLAWIIPVALLVVAHRNRHRQPLTWLGAVLFVLFLLPTLGLVPFVYQAYSTVADRYAYLALIGLGLAVSEAFDRLKSPVVAGIAVAGLAALTLAQSGNWLTAPDFLRHTIDVNPRAGFAFNNLGDLELASGDQAAALNAYEAAVRAEPTLVKAYINLAEVYTALDRPGDAEHAMAELAKLPDRTSDDFSNLGIVLMRMGQPARALDSLATAVAMDPDSPTYLFNQANALAVVGQLEQAEAVFRRCLAVAPTRAGAHTGLGIVLAQTNRLGDAITEFRAALRLQPGDPAATDDLKRAELMIQRQGG
jgi:tetratricopeptide (TPR) repeat protein